LSNDFARVEAEFRNLRLAFDESRITREQFVAALKALTFLHGGRYWMIGANSGEWYVYDGRTWVQAEPPSVARSAPAPRSAAREPSKPKRRVSRLLIALCGFAVILLAGGYWYWTRLPANDHLIHRLMSEPLPSYIRTTQPLGDPELWSNDKDADPGQVAEVAFPARNLRDDEAVIVKVFRSSADAQSSYEESHRSDTSPKWHVASVGYGDLANNTGYCLESRGKVYFCRTVVGRAVASLIAPKGEPQTAGTNAAEAIFQYLEVHSQ